MSQVEGMYTGPTECTTTTLFSFTSATASTLNFALGDDEDTEHKHLLNCHLYTIDPNHYDHPPIHSIVCPKLSTHTAGT